MNSLLKKFLLTLFVIFLLGFLLPEDRIIPVQGASSSDWNKDSFWYEPWGSSGVHKGVDIFATKGTPLLATTNLLILYQGNVTKGGNIIIGLGPKWRLHYFAHLDTISPQNSWYAHKGQLIGSIGDSGNAKGKQAHLHYSLLSLLPMPWKIDNSTQGYKKAFYLNPITYLSADRS